MGRLGRVEVGNPVPDTSSSLPAHGHSQLIIELVEANTFGNVIASDKDDQAFTIQIGNRTGLQSATLGGT